MAKEVKVKTSKTSKTLCFNINVDIMWTNCCFGLVSKWFAHYFWFVSAVNLHNPSITSITSSSQKTYSLSFGRSSSFFLCENTFSKNKSFIYWKLNLIFGLILIQFICFSTKSFALQIDCQKKFDKKNIK